MRHYPPKFKLNLVRLVKHHYINSILKCELTTKGHVSIPELRSHDNPSLEY